MAVPLNLRIGTVEVTNLLLDVDASAGRVEVIIAIIGSVDLGPMTATIVRTGITSQLIARGPDEPAGILGDLDVALKFKPPDGVGLAINAGALTGGGFLDFSETRQEYAGAVQLRFGTLSLAAFGLITTRLPDGRPGFSMIVLVTAEFGAVQLGFGFTLNAVGGLLGINRAAAVDALRAGVRDRSLSSVLFPRDVVRNAPRILSDLRSLFPATEGRHVFGPMARIGWGTPTIVALELGVILELPSPLRLIILGQLRMTLPTAEQAVATINMDAVGIVDFGTGEVSVDATIYDSVIGPFALSGDMALRARLREQPAFALAIGGFHPRFEPPAGFPELRRIALALATSENPRVRLEAYLALTSNTLQVGARLDVYAAVEVLGRWSVEAYLLFDALFEFSPFHFEVDIAAGVTLKRDGAVMFAVDLSLRISGPSPWRAIGDASFTFLGRHSVHVEVTAGEDAPPAQIEPADVTGQLVAALRDSRNWNAELPGGADATVVTLRRRPLEDGAVVGHPLGTLVVRQRVAPLERVITKFGNTRPRELRAYRITAAALGRSPADVPPSQVRVVGVQEHFASAQFFALSEEEKLSRPSFELMPAGVRLVPGSRAQWGFAASVDLEYETILVDREQNQRHPQEERFALSQDTLVGQAAFGAAAQAATRSSGPERFATAANRVVLRDPSFAVADTADMTQVPGAMGGDRGATYSEARAELERLAAGRADRGDGLQVVAAHEVISA